MVTVPVTGRDDDPAAVNGTVTGVTPVRLAPAAGRDGRWPAASAGRGRRPGGGDSQAGHPVEAVAGTNMSMV